MGDEFTDSSPLFPDTDDNGSLFDDLDYLNDVGDFPDLEQFLEVVDSKTKKNINVGLGVNFSIPNDAIQEIEERYAMTMQKPDTLDQISDESLYTINESDNSLNIYETPTSSDLQLTVPKDKLNGNPQQETIRSDIPVHEKSGNFIRVENQIPANAPSQCTEAPSRFSRNVTLSEFVKTFPINTTELFTETYGKTLLPFITPNGLSLEDFEDDAEYVYKSNRLQPMNKLPARYSGIHANYYEPLVVRYRRSEIKNEICGDGEGLCPYCAINGKVPLFYDRKDSNYLHHVSKLHGVYSNGNEMSFPSNIGVCIESKTLKTKGKISTPVNAAKCIKCGKIIKIQPFNGNISNKFLAYFRHMLTHNQRKNYGKTKGRLPDNY